MMSAVTKLWRSGETARIGGISVADRHVFIGTENGYIAAMDAETGELAWDATVPGEILAAPAADEGILVVNTGAGSLLASIPVLAKRCGDMKVTRPR